MCCGLMMSSANTLEYMLRERSKRTRARPRHPLAPSTTALRGVDMFCEKEHATVPGGRNRFGQYDNLCSLWLLVHVWHNNASSVVSCSGAVPLRVREGMNLVEFTCSLLSTAWMVSSACHCCLWLLPAWCPCMWCVVLLWPPSALHARCVLPVFCARV